MDDSDRVDWLNRAMREGYGLQMRYYSSAHEMPEGGWALYNGADVMGWGAEQRDAIDAAMAKRPLPVSVHSGGNVP